MPRNGAGSECGSDLDEILSALGAGGMGEVYRARDTRRDCGVVSPKISCSPHDVGHDGRMARIPSSNIWKARRSRRAWDAGALGVDEAIDLAVPIGDALDKAHRAGILHREHQASQSFPRLATATRHHVRQNAVAETRRPRVSLWLARDSCQLLWHVPKVSIEAGANTGLA